MKNLLIEPFQYVQDRAWHRGCSEGHCHCAACLQGRNEKWKQSLLPSDQPFEEDGGTPMTLVSFPVTLIKKKKALTKANQGKKYVFCLTLPGTVHHGDRSLKQLVTFVSTIRKQTVMNACCCSAPTPHLHSPGCQLGEWCHPQWHVFPPQFT